MARSRRRQRTKEPRRLGKQPPRYRFVLNPYTELRLTTCPNCRGRTLLRKIPLVVHVAPAHLVTLNKFCRYCRLCDLVMAHQDELEHMLVLAMEKSDPDAIGNDYLVVGTLDRADWTRTKKHEMTLQDTLERLHDFAGYLELGYDPGGWRPA